MEISSDTIYWVFSTLPQVIAALTGLLLTGTTFIFPKLDQEVEKNDSWFDIIDRVKIKIYKNVKWLLLISICAIIIDIVALVIENWLTNCFENINVITCSEWVCYIILWVVAISLNLASFVFLYSLLKKLLDPNFKNIARDELATEINKQEVKQEHDSASGKSDKVSIKDFWESFRAFENIIRQYGYSNPRDKNSLYETVKKIILTNRLPEEYLPYIEEMIRIRNVYAHGGKIEFVSKSLFDKLEEITATLNDFLINKRDKGLDAQSKFFFDKWISNNVGELTEAYELLQSIRFHQNYGPYRVETNDKSNRIRIEGMGEKPLYLDVEGNQEGFLLLLEQRFSKDGMTIEEQYDLKRALEKDD